MGRKTELIIVGLIVVAAFLYRVLPYLDSIFTSGGTWFLCPDSWYQMRLVDNMLANFPQPLWYDPYALFPDGAVVGYRPILTWLISGLAMVIGLGHPSTGLAEAVGAYLPPVLGSLMIIPVYVIGKVMFKRVGVGMLAALFVAFLPTELMHRSLLGFVDHHILETLLATLVIMFLALAWSKNKALWGIPAGVSLGLYMLNWHGALFFASILMGAFVIAFLIAYWRDPQRNWWYDPRMVSGIWCFGLAFILFIPMLPHVLSPNEFTVASIVIGVVPILLVAGGSLIKHRGIFFGILGGLVALGAVLIWWLAPWVYQFIFYQLHGTFWGFGSTISEALPLTISTVLMTWGFAFFLGLAGLVLAFKYKVDLPFLIWSMVIILATIGQRRWGYYSAINIALLAAFLLVYLSKYLEKSWRSWILGITVIALLLSVLPGSIGMLGARPFMTDDWQRSLQWVRENTPEPFDTPSVYYEMEAGEKPTYAIMSWWDYGHWIIRDARRVPMSSPTQQETRMAYMFFIAQSEEEAETALEGHNVRYIIIDYSMVFEKFYAMVLKSGQTSITPDYFYNSMVYRLFADEQVGWYKAVFVTPTVKVFERGGE